MPRVRDYFGLKDKHDYHRTQHGMWLFVDSEGNWQPFVDDRHMANTLNDPHRGWKVAFFTIVPDMALPAALM